MLRTIKSFVGIIIPIKPRKEAQPLRQFRNDPGMPKVVLGENEVKPRTPVQE